jgi:predicted PurR-regulated permease PerM
METTDFEKAWKTFEIIALIFILLSVLLILYFVRELLTPFIIAFVIVFFLNPIVDYMEGEGINRTLAVVTLIILGVFVLLIIWKLIWPTLQGEVNNFKDNAPVYIDRIQAGLNRTIDLLEKNISIIPKGTLEKALQQKINGFSSGMGDVGSLIKIVKGLMTALIIIPFVVFF